MLYCFFCCFFTILHGAKHVKLNLLGVIIVYIVRANRPLLGQDPCLGQEPCCPMGKGGTGDRTMFCLL